MARKHTASKPRHPSTSRHPLFGAVACALLLGFGAAANAQDSGQAGDPDSWMTDEFLADWGLDAIGAQHAYARGLTGQGIKLGVLDTGTSAAHSEFAGSGRLQSITFQYDYGDGFVFDVDGSAGYLVFGDHGTHVGGTIAASRNQDGTHGVAFGADLVAGSVGGIADTDILMPLLIGDVNEWVAQYGLPAVSEEELRSVMPDRWGLDFLDDIMATNYDMMAEQGVRAINNSWGYSIEPGSTFDDVAAIYEQIKDFPTIEAAARAVRDHDTLFVFSAGNDSAADPETGEPILTHTDPMGALPAFRPELADNWVTVVSLDENLERSGFSSICGQARDWCVSAPGGAITSSTFDHYPFSDYRLRLVGEAISLANANGIPGATVEERLENLRLLIAEDPTWQAYFLQTGIDITQQDAFATALQDMPEPAQDSLYADYSGTSMAAPHVTGALGLLMERFPYLDNTQVRDVMLTTATDLGEAGVDEIYGWGLVNLGKAIEGPGMLRVDTEVVMNVAAGGEKVWEGPAWDDWSNDISGPGRLTKSGIGWLRLSGDNSFAGATVKQGVLELDGDNALAGDVTVDGGMFQLDGSLDGSALTVNGGAANINGTLRNGATLVAAGGILGGIGTLGDTTVHGTVAPGNSIGTLTIDGDYVQGAGSTFLVELEPPSAADLLDVTGTATLQGGHVQVVQSPGSYVLGQTYNILSAAGGVSGTFSGVDTGTWNTPFLAFDLAYAPDAVTLDVARGAAFASVAGTTNQIATATALDALPDGNELVQKLVMLQEAPAVAAFDQLSGELYPSLRSALIDASRMPRDAVLDRARATSDGFSRQTWEDAPNGAWAQVYSTGGNLNADGNAERIDHDSSAILAGYDRQFDAGWRVGAMIGSGRTDFSVRSRGSEGDAQTRHFGVYGGGAWGGFGVRAGWVYAIHDIDTERNVAFEGFSDRTDADFDGRTRQAVIEAGYRFDQGRWEAEPFLQYADVRMSHDRIVEQGGAAALTGDSSDSKVGIATVGGRFNVNLKGSQQEQTWLSLRGMLGYRKTSGDRLPETRVAFAGGPAFEVAGAPLTDDAIVAEAGLAARTSASTLLEVGYSGQFADEGKDHGANLRFSWQF